MTNHTAGIELSEAHLAAVNRRRRVVVNFDASWYVDTFVEDMPGMVDEAFTFADDPGSHIDGIWWSWGQGQTAAYPSKLLPLYDREKYRQWVERGIDVAELYLEATKRRGLEAFFSYRSNAADCDLGTTAEVPIKAEHPEWTIRPWEDDPALREVIWLNFAFEEVRRYKLNVLREAAEKYDFDGIELDLQHAAVYFPIGHQWENRQILTDFVRSVRLMLQEVAARRGRPYLLAVRLGHEIEGCHFDGMDVQTWAKERLIDIFVPGCRSLEADVYAFRRITTGTDIKVYPVIEDHHAADGYSYPPIEVYRGAFSNWYRQGADGVQTFNFAWAPERMNAEQAEVQRVAYQEMGDPAAIKYKDKTFVVSRRGGGHGDPVVPDPEAWYTPRIFYSFTNMLAPLPIPLAGDGRTDTLLKLFIGDDLCASAQRVRDVTFRIMLHDAAAGPYVNVVDEQQPQPPAEGRIARGVIRIFRKRDYLYNSPPCLGIEKRIEIRINNILLAAPVVANGWLVIHDVDSMVFATGDNLVGVSLSGDESGPAESMRIEKMEVDVRYNQG